MAKKTSLQSTSKNRITQTITAPQTGSFYSEPDRAKEAFALVIVWSAEGAQRLGELAWVTGARPWILGRGLRGGEDQGKRLLFGRQLPDSWSPTGPLTEPSISRHQLTIHLSRGALSVGVVGRCPTFINGELIKESAQLSAGDLITFKNQVMLLCVERLTTIPAMPASTDGQWRDHQFGQPDSCGMVGESAAIWELRARLASLGSLDEHALILGESGAGKELAAQSIHKLSSRSQYPFVSRNAATIPDSLIDAELFGHAQNFPNPGMPERPGLLGSAHRGSLFLDEIGDLPQPAQTHLLRVMDNDGEYQRLGESQIRSADVRLIAATNRELEVFRADLLARFMVRVELSGLDKRCEDIPLLAQHLLRLALDDSPSLSRFQDSKTGHFRLDPKLIEKLLKWPYTTHIRELKRLLMESASMSTDQYISGAFIELPERRTSEAGPHAGSQVGSQAGSQATSTQPPVHNDLESLTKDDIIEALAETQGNVTRAARVLELSSRYALIRLLKKYEVDPADYRDA